MPPTVQIALKISEKIRVGERFAAYITIPLFPEGVPESGTVQEVLHWQSLTMQMMYLIVGQVRLNPHPAALKSLFKYNPMGSTCSNSFCR